MAPRYAALVALIFTVGAGLGRYTRPPELPLPDLRGPVWVLSLDRASRTNRHFIPVRVVVDGRALDVPAESPDGEMWRIDLAGGRIVLFVAAVPPPPKCTAEP